MRAEEFFAGSPVGLAVLARVRTVLAELGGCDERVSTSQVAFRRRRGFAYLWRPGRYLRRPAAEVVLSLALGRAVASPRFKEVVEPAPGQWMHHLELHGPEEVDGEVAGWLREAMAHADERAERPRRR